MLEDKSIFENFSKIANIKRKEKGLKVKDIAKLLDIEDKTCSYKLNYHPRSYELRCHFNLTEMLILCDFFNLDLRKALEGEYLKD